MSCNCEKCRDSIDYSLSVEKGNELFEEIQSVYWKHIAKWSSENKVHDSVATDTAIHGLLLMHYSCLQDSGYNSRAILKDTARIICNYLKSNEPTIGDIN